MLFTEHHCADKRELMIGGSSKLISNMVKEIVIAATIHNLQESLSLKKNRM